MVLLAYWIDWTYCVNVRRCHLLHGVRNQETLAQINIDSIALVNPVGIISTLTHDTKRFPKNTELAHINDQQHKCTPNNQNANDKQLRSET